ncbi:MAG: flagellar basal body-associated FliL family protein [Thiogranum sp.]|nr:flagellar basal body-associated FliL family protein [Thiogranum sp.]
MMKEDDLDLDVEGVEASPKSKKKLLIIGALVVLLLGISATAALLLTGAFSGPTSGAASASGTDAESGDSSSVEPAKAAQKDPMNYVPLDPPFVVNFSADSDIRFLQITLEAGSRDPAVIESIKAHRPAIRNSLVMLFSSQDPQALNSREGKEQLRAATLAELRKVLKIETGVSGVENVFFTSFVMQ